jgi:uncharacterized protein DUF5670
LQVASALGGPASPAKTGHYQEIKESSGATLAILLGRTRTNASGGGNMLFLVVLLLVLYFLGLVTSYTLGGILHILLVVAIVLFLVHIIQGRSIGEA